MEFSQDTGSATYRIKSYGPGFINVSGQDYHSPILILPEKLIAPWGVKDFASLKVEDFEAMLEFEPQVVLIGTGFDMQVQDEESQNMRRPDLQSKSAQSPDRQFQSASSSTSGSIMLLPKEVIRPLTDRGIGVEVMSTASACRTYTVLMSEGRNVAAGLFVNLLLT